jgi:hypothetical protein
MGNVWELKEIIVWEQKARSLRAEGDKSPLQTVASREVRWWSKPRMRQRMRANGDCDCDCDDCRKRHVREFRKVDVPDHVPSRGSSAEVGNAWHVIGLFQGLRRPVRIATLSQSTPVSNTEVERIFKNKATGNRKRTKNLKILILRETQTFLIQKSRAERR